MELLNGLTMVAQLGNLHKREGDLVMPQGGRDVQCSTEAPCTAVQLLVQRTGKLEELVDKMQNRLPPWVMAATWISGTIIGVLGTLVAVASK